MRNLFAEPVLDPGAERWFAQRLDAFNTAYDYTALMAMPQLEDADDPQRWMRRLVAAVAAQPEGLERTIFEIQTVDWRTQQPIPPQALRRQARALVAAGVRHLAYYPDDAPRALPPLPARAKSPPGARFMER